MPRLDGADRWLLQQSQRPCLRGASAARSPSSKHLEHIFEKLGVEPRSAAVALATGHMAL